jgi:hypothetical protein
MTVTAMEEAGAQIVCSRDVLTDQQAMGRPSQMQILPM